MVIELFHSPHCPVCRALDPVGGGDLVIVRRDLVRHLEEAVRLGITQPPALVVDGRVIAQGAAVVAATKKLIEQGPPP
jgi:hypothetical protein